MLLNGLPDLPQFCHPFNLLGSEARLTFDNANMQCRKNCRHAKATELAAREVRLRGEQAQLWLCAEGATAR